MKMLKKQLPFSMALILTVMFSLMSTGAFAQPANDDCADAIAISCGDIISGSNVDASADVVVCNTVVSQHGVWYTLVGNGGDITLSTCNDGTDFDTQIAVFDGSCGNLSCVAGNNNDPSCGNARFSTVNFLSEAGTTYYVLVNGVVGAEGNFQLSIDCLAPPIENDDCADAIAVGCGDVVLGSTAGASNESLPFCGTSLSSAPGVWYAFAGNGDEVTVTTCGAGTNFDTKLGVFSGSCGALSCVGGDDDEFSCNFSSLQSLVVFQSTPGVTYYIYVTGFSSSSGDFELSVSCDNVNVPDNDDCANAEAISCGDVVSGSTDDASSESLAFCGTSLSTAGGVWYSLEGTGGSVTASLCGSGYDTKIGVFSGSCGSLSCVTGNDDFCGLQSQVSFDTDAGTTYYIYVTGFSSGAGSFNLAVTCENTEPEVSTCDNAEAVDCDDVITGNTENGTVNELAMCNGLNLSTATGVWYTIEGSGLLVTVDVNGADYFDSQVGIYSGSCDNLSCVTANNNAFVGTRDASASFAALAGETYYIYVTGLLGASGEFEMSLSCALLNDNCDGAIGISCGETVSGSTTDATSNPDTPYCDGSFTSARTAWYAIMGDDSEMTVSLCGSSYDTKVGVFEGACGALACVVGNDDECGLQSEVVFQSVAGVTYYIAVSGYSTFSYGNYTLSVSCYTEPAPGGDGDTCGEAMILPVGTTCVGTIASNDGATDSGEGTPSCASYQGGDVWFAVTIPASGDVVVETSSAGGFTDSGMAAYTGSCGGLTQIACDDDGGAGLFSRIALSGQTPGTVVYFRVWEYGNNSFGDFSICAVEPQAITNDDCASATPLTVGSAGVCNNITSSNDGATDSGIANPGCGFYSGGDVWFSLLIPGSGNVTIETSSAGGFTDSGMAVYNNSCGSLDFIECDDDGGAGLFSLITLTNQVAGTTLWVRVWEYGNNSFGNFNICAYEPGTTSQAAIVVDGAEEVLNNISRVDGEFYPNPTSVGQIVNIDIKAENDVNADIMVFDNTGRMVKNIRTELFGGENQVSLTTDDLAAGTYIVSMKIADQIIHKKLIVVN